MPSDFGNHRRPTTVKNHHYHGAPPSESEHLPCPRCNSTNTKFCYYNNYNFSQSRHFCKACRRYWTQGGTLRDIPVGGGSRKNAKRSCGGNDSGLEYRSILPSAVTTPVLMSFGGVHCGAHDGTPSCGGFTALLSSAQGSGLFGNEVCGFDQNVSFGLGRTFWPFSGIGGGVVGGNSGGAGGGSTWQLESGEGGGDCFLLPDLAISTPRNGMKLE